MALYITMISPSYISGVHQQDRACSFATHRELIVMLLHTQDNRMAFQRYATVLVDVSS